MHIIDTINRMDLTLHAGAFTLNIRVAVILRIKDKIILEKSTEGYYFWLADVLKQVNHQ